MNADAASDIEPIEAILASLRVWFLEVVATLLDLFGEHGRIGAADARELRGYLRDVQFDLKRAIFLLAVARIESPQPGTGPYRPAAGFRIRRFRQSALRLVTHGVFKRMRAGDVRARVARLRDVVENAEAWIVRMAKRLARGFNGAHRILAAPPVERAHSAPTLAAPQADTS